ncbi:MAG: hypothetical protein ABR956_00995 [Terracidiphilus sp.]|jgi:hypothetical protein
MLWKGVKGQYEVAFGWDIDLAESGNEADEPIAVLFESKEETRMKLTRNEWLLRAGRGLRLSQIVMGLIAVGLVGIALGELAHAQAVSTTTVQGTVYLADGQAASGTLNVSWPAFTTANGQAVTADSTTVTIGADGFVSVNLTPNLGATPAGLYYTAVFYLSDGSTNTQYWVVPAAAQASLAQVQAQLMPAAQAVQAVSKSYVDQSITELSSTTLMTSGSTMTGPLYLSGDPVQPLQAADKHYVDESLALAVPLAGGNMTGDLTTPAVNGVQSPAAGSADTTLQSAINAAGANGAVEIPPTYAGMDTFLNPSGVYVADLRSSGAQQTERSVKEFGAVCNGTTDDTNALQAAINYAQTHGVALTIPQGTCKTRALNWHGESIGGMGKQVSALMGFPGQDVLVSITDSANLLSYTRIHDLTIYVDQSVDVSCTAAEGRAPAGSCAVGRQLESNSIFSPGGNGLTGTAGTGTAWAVGNCAIAMPAATGAGGNGLRVAVVENLEIATTGVDPMAAQYPGAHSTHTCGLFLGQWPQWSEFRNIDIRGLNTGVAIPALAGAIPAGLISDSNRWEDITIEATHGFTAAAGSHDVLDNVVVMAGNSAATDEPPTGLVLDFAGTQSGWILRTPMINPTWTPVQPQLTVAAAGGAVTAVTVGSEHGLGFDPYGTQIPVAFSGSCTAQAAAGVNSNGSIGAITVTQGGVGCSGTTTASLNVAKNWDTAAPVNLISGQNMSVFGGNLLHGSGGYTVWSASASQSYGTQLGGGGGNLPGGGSYSGLVENSPLGASVQVDQFPGADFGAKVQACLNALSASYGGTCDARNFTGTQQMGSNLTISTANASVLLPCATISTASQLIVTAGTRNVSLRGCSLRGASTASGSQGGTVFLYSGTGAMVQVGDPTYAADTMGFHMDSAVINTTASSSATAQALAAYRTQEMDVDGLYLLGNSNQTGMTLDGTGNYTGGSFFGDQISGFQTAVNAIGHQISNPATTDWMNASTFVRLHIDCPTSGGNPIAGTYGINLQQGDGNTFTGGDVEGCSTALHLGANAQNNTIVGLRNENSTSQVLADAGSTYNNWMTGGAMLTGKLTDNGTRNSFLDTFHRSFNGMNGDWYGSQQDATVTNHWRLGIGTGNERGLLNEIQTDYGYRWTEGYTDATSGVQFYQIQDLLNNVPRFSIAQYNNGQSSTNNQTVVNAAGTGAIVLNGSNNAGTGGVVFGSGGSSETTVATVNNAGNAQFNGTLEVGGTSTFTGSTTVRNQLDTEIDEFLWAGLTASQKESLIYKDWNGNSQWYMEKDASNNWELNSATGGLDSFKAYQSTNSGDTYIDASNPSGVVRINYESGAGTGFKIYGGSSNSLYASFTAANAIQFPGLAASNGTNCLQVDNSGYVSSTGSACGSGSSSGGNGVVGSGLVGQIAYYTNNGTTIGGLNAVPVTAGGTGATTAAGALANLGGAALTGATFTGPVAALSTNGVQTVPSGGNIQAAITAAGTNGTVNLTPGVTYTVTTTPGLTLSYDNVTLNFNGACIKFTGAGDGILITSPNPSGVVINNPCLIPGAASTGASIHDAGGIGTTINNPTWFQSSGNSPTTGYYWYYLLQVDGDEQFIVNNAEANGTFLRCDSTFCGDFLYNTPGLGTGSAAIAYINNASYNLENDGNGIDWSGYGNDIHLSSVIIENMSQFALRSVGAVLCNRCHFEDSGSSTNPSLGGLHAVADVIMNGGQIQANASYLSAMPPAFTATGATGTFSWQYWVIAHSATYGDTAPMPFGMVTNAPATWQSSPSTTVPLTFPAFIPTSGDTITCTILRATGTSTAPYPNDGVADVVASGQACGSSTASSWTYFDSVPTANLTAYNFTPDTYNGFFPAIQNWGGASVVLSAGNVNASQRESTFTGSCFSGTTFVTVRNYGYFDYPQVNCEGSAPLSTPNWYAPVNITATGAYINAEEQTAFVMQNAYPVYSPTGVKGVLNLGNSGAQDTLTVYDSNRYKTLATAGNRPSADLGDAAIGMDSAGSGFAERGPTSISWYINHFFDNSSYVARLTASGMTYTVPVTAPILAGALSGNAATATALASAPAQCSAGQYSTGISTTGAASCAQVAYSQVSGTPATSGTGNVALVNAPTFTGNTTTFANNAASTDFLIVEPGTSSTPESGGVELASQSGIAEFLLEEDTSYDLKIHDSGASTPMDVFTAYVNGQTNINSQGATGVAINNASSGSGTGGLTVYAGGSNYNTMIAAFTGTTSIRFPGLAASSGHNCAQFDTSGYLTNTGGPCGTANQAATQTWNAAQTFNNGDLVLAGSSSGSTTVETAATGGGTVVLPAAVNSPAKIPQVIFAGSIALATSSILSGACQTVTAGSVNSVAATSVASTDIIDWSPQTSLQSVSGYGVSTGGALSIDAYPTAGYINLNVCNHTAGSVTPGALTLNVRVIR